jgi:hypothetical protein
VLLHSPVLSLFDGNKTRRQMSGWRLVYFTAVRAVLRPGPFENRSSRDLFQALLALRRVFLRSPYGLPVIFNLLLAVRRSLADGNRFLPFPENLFI